MCNYVNEDVFFTWYDGVIAKKPYDREAVLREIFDFYIETGEMTFRLSESRTATGRAESYRFRAENIGCCGASTMFIYF